MLQIANPIPPYPTVSGCEDTQFCVLKGSQEGLLNCSLRGVRPAVGLKVIPFLGQEKENIDLTREEYTITTNGETYNITVIIKYALRVYQSRMTFECRTDGENAEIFDLSKKFELLFTEGMLLNITKIVLF